MGKTLLIIGAIGFFYTMNVFAANAEEVAKKSTEDKVTTPTPRLAVLGNDAAALTAYCVFQSQVYSVGVAFCSGEKILLLCIKGADNTAVWSASNPVENCKNFGK